MVRAAARAKGWLAAAPMAQVEGLEGQAGKAVAAAVAAVGEVETVAGEAVVATAGAAGSLPRSGRSLHRGPRWARSPQRC